MTTTTTVTTRSKLLRSPHRLRGVEVVRQLVLLGVPRLSYLPGLRARHLHRPVFRQGLVLIQRGHLRLNRLCRLLPGLRARHL
jgi:hypothetical protein